MKQTNIVFFVFIVLASCLIPASGCREKAAEKPKPVSFRDDIGRTIELPGYPARIVSLAPNVTEIIFALGGEDRLAGVTDYCDYPPAAGTKPTVGGMYNPNYERILELDADLVITTKEGRKKESIEYLEQFGIPTFVSHSQSIDGIFQSMERIAELLQVPERARVLRDSLKAEIESVLAFRKDRNEKPRVLFLLQLKPIFSIGAGTYIHEMLRLLQLRNLGIRQDTPYPKLSRETVLVENPDAIILTSDAVATVEEVYTAYPEWQKITAIQKKQVFVVDSDIVSRPGPRMADALRALRNIVIQID